MAALVLMCAASPSPAAAQEAPPPAAPAGFHLAPELRVSHDLGVFVYHKNQDFKERYLVDWLVDVDMAFAGWGPLYFWGTSSIGVGVGEQDAGTIVDGRFLDLSLGLMGEMRRSSASLWFGADHTCFHSIDRREFGSTFWNHVFLAATSADMDPRLKRLRLKTGPETDARRFGWAASLGWLPAEIPGVVSPTDFSDGHPYHFNVKGGLSWVAWRGTALAAVLHGRTGAWITRGGKVYSRHDVRAELVASRGNYHLALFADAVLADQLIPRLNRDRLVQIGISASR